ncbi:MAG TPA: tetratricopeptide repeat protein, partial [Gemmatimonadaceae bacterium]|nr:tetratricopeptide repeat protein [Gemmatimonadaceae bacterium]
TWAAAAAAAFLAVALAITALARQRPAGASTNAVAVLPFEVRGSGDVAYLREGMTDLLSTNLDGAGALRSVDPRAVLGMVAREEVAHVDPDDARRLANRLGAGLVVLGDVVASGSNVRISATLYDQRPGGDALARGAVDGPLTDLFAMVDQLTRQLLAGYPDRSSDRLTGLAARTTTSLPALKSYLDGVALYRRASYHDALDAFEQAAAQDTTFALAHYQLSNAALWAAEGTWDSIAHAGQRAVRYSDRLTRRARLLVEAHYAFRSGDLDRAEQLYRQTVTSFPDDVEGWYQLGDVLFHGNPPRGRSMTESRDAFEHLLALEPTHRGAMIHLLRVAMLEGRRDEARALIERALALTQASEQPELLALRAALDDDDAARAKALAGLARTDDEVVRVAAMRVALFTGDLSFSRRISELLLAPTRLPDFRVVGRLHLANIALARGRPREALAQLDSVELESSTMAPVIAREYRALALSLPFLPADSAAIRTTLETLATARPVPVTRFPMFAVYNDVHPVLRTYFMGVLSSRLGDEATVRREAAELDVATGNGEARALAAELAAGVRARDALRRGDHRAALAALDGRRARVSEGLLDGWVGDQALERWTRAEALHATGREAEAAGWYESLGQTAMHQAVYLAPAALRLGEIAERRRDRQGALAHYRRAITLWNDCDPELRPLVDRARLRVAALTR